MERDGVWSGMEYAHVLPCRRKRCGVKDNSAWNPTRSPPPHPLPYRLPPHLRLGEHEAPVPFVDPVTLGRVNDYRVIVRPLLDLHGRQNKLEMIRLTYDEITKHTR